MGALIGFIVMFLGSSILNVLGGIPLVPLQTLWVNFTTQVFMAVGLGYGKPAPDLMERKPRPIDEPILGRDTLAWLAIAGFVLGGTTLGVIWWAHDHYDNVELARTMGLTTFSIANVYLAYTVKDRFRSIFDLETFADRRLLMMTGFSALAIVLGTELRIFQRFLDTVSLTGRQWVICILAAATILVASEIQKLVLRRRAPAEEPHAGEVADAVAVTV
jgi:Ca2+-transporting ATPase